MKKIIHGCVLAVFVAQCILPPDISAQIVSPTQSLFSLPVPGARVDLSPAFAPALMRGMKLSPHDPFQFHFMVDAGDSGFVETQDFASLQRESTRLIQYFLAALTLPEEDLWVNLSPYEKDRVITPEFASTEMGRDLLSQDYILKQLSASLLYPEKDLGKKFWDAVYQKAYALYGTTDIPVDTFHKIWIVPHKAVVYEKPDGVFIVDSELDVMLEEDYVNAREHNSVGARHAVPLQPNTFSTPILRQTLLPAIKREVNHGKNFAVLRQIYYSLILATWFKRHFRETVLGQNYADRKKVAGIDSVDAKMKDEIYRQYLAAFKKGVHNYIREELDPHTQEIVPRKYFAGGFGIPKNFPIIALPQFPALLPARPTFDFTVQTRPAGTRDGAMLGNFFDRRRNEELILKRCVELLTARTGVSFDIKMDVVGWLGELADPRVMDILLDGLDANVADFYRDAGIWRKQGEIRAEIVETLGRRGHAAAIPYLLQKKEGYDNHPGRV